MKRITLCFILLFSFLLVGCKHSNPGYYKSVDGVVSYLESAKLPGVAEPAEGEVKYVELVEDIGRLAKAVDSNLDAHVVERPSYKKFEEVSETLLKYTKSYWLCSKEKKDPATFETDRWTKHFQELRDRLKTQVAELKQAAEKETGGKAK